MTLVDILLIVPTILKAIGGLLMLYFFLMLLPLVLQVMMNIFISMIRAQLRLDIRPILNVIFFPGSLLRFAFIWIIMKYYGFTFGMSLFMPKAGDSAALSNSYYRGPTFSSLLLDKDMKVSPIKLGFVMSLASYAILPIFVILLLNYHTIRLALYLILPYNLVVPGMNFFLLSLGIGGLPVPQETLSVLYAILYTFPHLVIGVFLNGMGALILAAYLGPLLALFLFLFFTLLIIFIQYVYKPVYEGETDPMLLLLESMQV